MSFKNPIWERGSWTRSLIWKLDKKRSSSGKRISHCCTVSLSLQEDVPIRKQPLALWAIIVISLAACDAKGDNTTIVVSEPTPNNGLAVTGAYAIALRGGTTSQLMSNLFSPILGFEQEANEGLINEEFVFKLDLSNVTIFGAVLMDDRGNPVTDTIQPDANNRLHMRLRPQFALKKSERQRFTLMVDLNTVSAGATLKATLENVVGETFQGNTLAPLAASQALEGPEITDQPPATSSGGGGGGGTP